MNDVRSWHSPDTNPVEFDGIKMQSNLENLNALFIAEGLPQSDRLIKLNQIAIHQMKLLAADSRLPRLPGPKETGDE